MKQKDKMPDLIIASGPVIIEDKKVLLIRHGDDGLWKFPGGKVEWAEVGDSFEELEKVCLREVSEEMNLEIEILRPLKPMLIKRPDKPEAFVVLIHFLAKRVGEIKPGDDILEWDWFPIDQLPEQAAPNVAPVLAELSSSSS